MEIVTQYSLWWMLPIVLIALGLSALLYYRNARESFPIWVNISLGLLRFSVFTILGFLLLNPMLKSWTTEVQKPIILLLQDESQSVVLNADSNFYKDEYPEKINKLISDLQGKYEVKTFSFSDKLKSGVPFRFNGLNTNLSGAVNSLYDQYSQMNIGAIIIATDGIYNKGQNPLYAMRKVKFPIYFIGLGDTVEQSDLLINRQAYNKTVFLGNKFPIEVEVISKKAMGEKSELRLYHKGKLIDKKRIEIKSDNQKNILRFYIDAKESGLQNYSLIIVPIEKELNKQNNRVQLFVNVIDSKQKILILYDSPHPDISAIKSALDSYETYEVERVQFNKFRKKLKAYNMVILHQLPSKSSASFRVLQQLKSENIPYLMILGTNSNLPNINALRLGVEIVNNKMNLNTVSPVLNNSFSSFILSDDLKQIVNELPPLSSPYGKYRVSKAAQVLFSQKIGSVKTEVPLIALLNQSGWRSAFIFGEGVWRWRLYDYKLNGNHEIFDELVGKIVRYISVIKEHSNFDIEVKKHFEQTDEIVFNAVLYNDSYEPIVEHEIEMLIKNEQDKEFVYSFSKRDSSYFLSVGSFEPGIYHYIAKVSGSSKMKSRKGAFTVNSSNIESRQLTANFSVLQMIAQEHDAKVYPVQKFGQLMEDIIDRDDIVNLEYNHLKYVDLIDFKWFLALIIILLGTEWFIRKQTGSY